MFGYVPDDSYSGMCAVAGWCLAGLPIICLAYYGLLAKSEALIRVYFYYAVVTIVGDLLFVLVAIVSQGCDDMVNVLVQEGEAFACGVTRIAEGIIGFSAFSIQAYFIFLVWSCVEDISTG